MPFDNLLVERDSSDPRIALVVVNRPQVRNALNRATIDELGRVAHELQRDDSVRVVVITGAGDKAFVAGADINEFTTQTSASAHELALAGQRAFALIEHLGKPVIASINGFALGGGCELAMACTLRIAADTAMLGQPEVNLGILPGYGATQRLPRLVGKGRALELMLTGAMISAVDAERMGLVNRVVPAASLRAETTRLATRLAGQAPLAMRYILDAVHQGNEMPLAEGSAHEAALFGLVASTDDMREGARAFLEKRTPEFKGR